MRQPTALAQRAVCGVAGFDPDSCLINLYAADGRMNLHQDHDEADFAWPGGGRSVYVRDPAGNSIEFADPAIWEPAG